MAKTRVIYSASALQALLLSPTGPVAVDMMRRGKNVKNRAQSLCPVDTGRLKASITHELFRGRPTGERTLFGSVSAPIVRVGTNVPYATYVHEGTGLYGPRHRMITPRTRTVMRFVVRTGGRRGVVYTPRTRGVQPRPFLEQALSAAAG